MTEAGGRIEIGRIGITGAPAAMRDGAAFVKLLDAALVQAMDGVPTRKTKILAMDTLRIRIRQGAGIDEIAAAIAAKVADAAREG